MKNKSFVIKKYIIPFIICLVISFIIWIYVMSVDSPDYETEIDNIPISIIGTSSLEDNNLSIFSGSDLLIDMKVKGQKSTISKYSDSDYIIKADVSEINDSGTYLLDLYFDLPSGITLVDSSVSQINLYIDKKISKNIYLKAKVSSYQLGVGYEIGDVVLENDTISVSGAEEVINEISYALAEVSFNDNTLTETTKVNSNIVLYDINDNPIDSKYIKLSQSTVSVTVPIFTTKEVILDVTSKNGFYTSNNSTITVSPSTVVVRGDTSLLKDLNTLTVTSINEKLIDSDTTFTVDLSLPDGISLENDELSVVSVDIKFNNMKKKTLKVTNISVINNDFSDYTIITPTINVEIFGESSIIDKISSDDIILTADLSGYTNVNSSTMIYPSASVTIKNYESSVAYEIGTYSVQILIK